MLSREFALQKRKLQVKNEAESASEFQTKLSELLDWEEKQQSKMADLADSLEMESYSPDEFLDQFASQFEELRDRHIKTTRELRDLRNSIPAVQSQSFEPSHEEYRSQLSQIEQTAKEGSEWLQSALEQKEEEKTEVRGSLTRL